MMKIIIVSRNTPQSTAFMKALSLYIETNQIDIQSELVIYPNLAKIAVTTNAVLLMSPEVLVYEKEIREKVKDTKLEIYSCKPVDFGMKNIEKILIKINVL